MRAFSRPRSIVWLAAGLAVLLIGLAALQWRWIGRWSAVEEARLESTLRTGAAALNRDLTTTLYILQEAFENIPAADDAAADALATALHRWQSSAEMPELVKAVYWVTPGPSPQLRQLEGRTLQPASLSGSLAPWRTTLQSYPPRLQPAPGTSAIELVLDEPTFPDRPPGLLIPSRPSLPVLGRSGLPLRFIFVELAEDVLRDQLVPDRIREHIVGHDLYDIRVTGQSGVLYDSRPGLTDDTFDAPDLDHPLGPSDVTELVFTLNTETETADEEIDLASLQTETQAGAGRWRLLVRHRAGSIAAATRQLRMRQLALAFGVLAVLGAATALLLLSVRRQRALAQRQLAFVAGVTHELRTPLAVLHAAGENLSDGVVDDPDMAQQYGTLVREESRRLADMVETVLTYAGADATTARRSRLSVADWVQDAVEQAQPVLNETHTTVTLNLDPDLPDLEGDPLALATALRNLLANAARHGGPSVHISARTTRGDRILHPPFEGGARRAEGVSGNVALARPRSDGEANTPTGYARAPSKGAGRSVIDRMRLPRRTTRFAQTETVELAVSDDGPGIAPSDRATLFEPFVRGQSAMNQQTPGSGLGLALVRRIVEAHGGTVELATTPETTFTITIPTRS